MVDDLCARPSGVFDRVAQRGLVERRANRRHTRGAGGFDEFLDEPDKPLHGDLMDFADHQRGVLACVVELWDLFQPLGIARKKPFVDHNSKFTRDDLRALAAFDCQHNAGRIFGSCWPGVFSPWTCGNGHQRFVTLRAAPGWAFKRWWWRWAEPQATGCPRYTTSAGTTAASSRCASAAVALAVARVWAWLRASSDMPAA